MPIDSAQAPLQSAGRDAGDVVLETLGGNLGQLHRAVAAHADEEVALYRKYRVKHPVGMAALIKHLLAGLGINGAQGIVGAAEGDELGVVRPADAVNGIEGDRD